MSEHGGNIAINDLIVMTDEKYYEAYPDEREPVDEPIEEEEGGEEEQEPNEN